MRRPGLWKSWPPYPLKIASPIEDRHLRRCFSYKEVKEEVEWEARKKNQCRSLQGYLQEYCGAGSLHGIATQWDL